MLPLTLSDQRVNASGTCVGAPDIVDCFAIDIGPVRFRVSGPSLVLFKRILGRGARVAGSLGFDQAGQLTQRYRCFRRSHEEGRIARLLAVSLPRRFADKAPLPVRLHGVANENAYSFSFYTNDGFGRLAFGTQGMRALQHIAHCDAPLVGIIERSEGRRQRRVGPGRPVGRADALR
ncbi:MAG: hypothetical protein ACRYG5_02860 [Janthinobacterium lividum]